MRPIAVLSIASEVYPLVKTGGLADVAGALPAALKREGVAVRTLMPGYPAVTKALRKAEAVHAYADLFGGPARILSGRAAGARVIGVRAGNFVGYDLSPAHVVVDTLAEVSDELIARLLAG